MYKKIGILGGMSPESTIEYYQYITHTYTQRFGDHGYPEIILYSVTFQPYVDWPKAGRWDLVARGLGEAARKLQDAGADFIIIATNTMHIVVDEIRAQIDIPILSLPDVVADAIQAKGIQNVGLLGTAFTMGNRFYHNTLEARGIQVITPDQDDQLYINQVIYDELVNGKILPESRKGYLRIMDKLSTRGARGVILGCTEIPLLIKPTDTDLPLFDTTLLHAEAALNYAIGK
ncbi:MAG: aspartate/glutamate racemase family protein [Chloroflexi bacterium]|nr:aspartate/glutamate racemase family protein [Chloroflexota bacterium]